MRAKRILLLALAVCLSLLLSACRTRTGSSGQAPALQDAASGLKDETRQGENASADASFTSAPESDPADAGENGDAGGRTKENPDARRKEYDEDAPAELMPGTDRLLHGEGEGNGRPVSREDAAESADQLRDQAEKAATQTVAAQEAEQTGVSEDAAAADSAMTYFTVLLQDRLKSLYECQRVNVYWETAEDHVTIHKTSPEHALILNAGLYDVSARLLPENLQVDDGWVARKNPGLIVKIVDSGVLGGGVSSTGAAKAVYESIRSREGWAATDAVKNGRVILLSEELLEAPYLQTAAMLMIAKTANPSALSDVDPEEALRMLTEEAAGTIPFGTYYYCKGE